MYVKQCFACLNEMNKRITSMEMIYCMGIQSAVYDACKSKQILMQYILFIKFSLKRPSGDKRLIADYLNSIKCFFCNNKSLCLEGLQKYIFLQHVI